MGTFLALWTIFIGTTIFTVALLLPAGASTFRERAIIPSVLVTVLTGPGNSAAAVLSSALLRSTVVVHILLLTLCYCYTGTLDIPLAAIVAMFHVGWLVSGRVGRDA